MNKIKPLLLIVLIAAAAVVFFIIRNKNVSPANGEATQEITPFFGGIRNIISSTGTVLPRNRLEILPPVSGRIDSILVTEGASVKAGDIMAWMSSTERAALLDSARGQGQEELKKWEEVYKPISLSAPVDGSVIVSRMQPGQTVNTSDAVIVLSDTLIVRAQVDETDIGKIKIGMPAVLTLDAYSKEKIPAKVQHIYYESKTVSNVTIYEVDLIPYSVPGFFRSGMNASVDFEVENKENVLLLPQDAVRKAGNRSFITVKNNGSQPVEREIATGISDDKNIEIVSGLGDEDVIVVKSKKYKLPTNSMGKNPFMPKRPGADRQKNKRNPAGGPSPM